MIPSSRVAAAAANGAAADVLGAVPLDLAGLARWRVQVTDYAARVLGWRRASGSHTTMAVRWVELAERVSARAGYSRVSTDRQFARRTAS